MRSGPLIAVVALLIATGCCKPQSESLVSSVDYIDGPGLSDEAMYQPCELEEAEVVLVLHCWGAQDLDDEQWFALRKTRQLPETCGFASAGCGGDVGINASYSVDGLANDEMRLKFDLTWRDYRPNAAAAECNLADEFVVPVGAANCRPIQSAGGAEWRFESGADFRAEWEARRAQAQAMAQARQK